MGGRQIYLRDRYAIPDHLPALRRAGIHRATLLALRLDALPKDPQQRGVGLEVPVAATLVRRVGGEAWLTLLRVVNDAATLKRLLDMLIEALTPLGVRALLGPCEASPYLGAGALVSHWQHPPLLTPYNPPYLPELLGAYLAPVASSTLYRLPAERTVPPRGPADVRPLAPGPFDPQLMPALQAAWQDPLLPPPDAGEARLIAGLLSPYPVETAVAYQDGNVVGAALLMPDLAPALRCAGGAGGILGRLVFHSLKRRPAALARLVFLGVVPAARGQGIGNQLLAYALKRCREQGIKALTIGPIPDQADTARWLQRLGAEQHRHYTLFRLAW